MRRGRGSVVAAAHACGLIRVDAEHHCQSVAVACASEEQLAKSVNGGATQSALAKRTWMIERFARASQINKQKSLAIGPTSGNHEAFDFSELALTPKPYCFGAGAVAAFFVDFRRRFGRAGRPGTSPTTSADHMLVTNFFMPWSSNSTVVRSESDSVTVPTPYCICRTVCPVSSTCTKASLTAGL